MAFMPDIFPPRQVDRWLCAYCHTVQSMEREECANCGALFGRSESDDRKAQKIADELTVYFRSDNP